MKFVKASRMETDDALDWFMGTLDDCDLSALWAGLSTKERILLLLYQFGKPKQFDVYRRLGEIPRILTQKGMADALGKHVSEVQTAIKGPSYSLLARKAVTEISKRFIRSQDLRIRGGKYRYHLVYILTKKGMAEATDLRNKLVSVQT